MSTAFSRLRNLWTDALGLTGLILRKSKKSNARNDPSLTAADGEPDDTIDAEPNASVRLVGDATDPDRAMAVRVGGVWYYAQLAAEADTAVLDAHLNGGTGKHDATEVDYERADGSKKNISASSDAVEAALSDLDDATGLLSSLVTTVKTSAVAAINEVAAKAGLLTRETAATGAKLILYEGTDNGTSKVTIQSPATLGADRTITVPDADIDLSPLASTGVLGTLAGYGLDFFVVATVVCPDATGGATDTIITVSLFRLDGTTPVASARQFNLRFTSTQYSGSADNSPTLGTVTSGSIVASLSGLFLVECGVNGVFSCTVTNVTDEVLFVTAVSVVAGSGSASKGCAVLACIPDSITWS